MDDDLTIGRIGPSGREDAVLRALRALYAGPQHPVYWEVLEARIMGRIAQDGDAWWTAFQGWVRLGLAAATVALVAAGMALVQSREADARMAYQSVVNTPRLLAQQIATETSGLPEREATLRYVISP